MPFNVNEMLGTINASGGFSKSSKFLVSISPPLSMRGDISGDFVFFCDSTYLPGLAFQTDEIRPAGYGNVNKRPYASIFQDVQCTFYNDSDGKVFKFFHRWMQSIYNFNDSTNPNATARGLFRNSFAYPADYHGVVDIIHFDDNKDQTEIIKYQLQEAYPIRIDDIQVDWNQNDQLLKIPVAFAYSSWSAETLDPGTIDYRSQARANSLTTTITRVDDQIRDVTQLLNRVSSTKLRTQFVNSYASRLPSV